MAATQYRALGPGRALRRALHPSRPGRPRHGARTLAGAGAALLCAAALACGSGDSGDGGAGYGEESGSEAPAVSAQESAQGGSGAGSAGEATPPEVQSCLDLVGAAKFREAVPVCLRAVEAAPGNEEVKQALDRAQREVATSEAGEAAGSAKEAAEEEAGKAAEGASEALRGMGD